MVSSYYREDMVTKKVYSIDMKRRKIHNIDMIKSPEEFISVNTSVWNKLYRKDVFNNINELYEKIYSNPRFMEDVFINMFAAINVEKICILNKALYHYNIHDGSISNMVDLREIYNIIEAFINFKNIVLENKRSKLTRETFDCIAFLHLGISIMLKVYQLNKNDFYVIYKDIDNTLKKHFSNWESSKFLTLRYSIFHKGVNLKLAIMKKIYKFKLLKIFFAIYIFINKKLKIDIKW